MKQIQFEQIHQARWQRFEQTLTMKGVEENGVLRDFPSEYRFICHSLSLAKARNYSPQLIDYLNHLMLQGHRKLYQGQGFSFLRIVHFVVKGFPLQVQQYWKFVLAAHLLFYLPTLITFGIVQWDGALAYEFISADQLAHIEGMYDPSAEHIGRDRGSGSDWMMFGHYIQNNIGISFKTYASGLLAGLGSIFFLCYNGVYFGVISSHLFSLGYTDTFFSFVIGHGSFELTAITLSGAAGLRLGLALIAPGQWRRSTALKMAANDSIQIVFGVILMLLIAAFVEAFWSSMATVPAEWKYGVGVVLWLLVYGYLFFSGRANASR